MPTKKTKHPEVIAHKKGLETVPNLWPKKKSLAKKTGEAEDKEEALTPEEQNSWPPERWGASTS